MPGGCASNRVGPACRCRQVLTTRQHEQSSSPVQHPRGPHTSSNATGSTLTSKPERVRPDPGQVPAQCSNRLRARSSPGYLTTARNASALQQKAPAPQDVPPPQWPQTGSAQGSSHLHQVSARQDRPDAGQARPGPGALQQPAPSAHLSPLPGRLSLLQGSSGRAIAPPRGHPDPRSPSMPHTAPHSAATLVQMFRPPAPSDYAGETGRSTELTELAFAMFSGSAIPPHSGIPVTVI
ncbi:hypothetical protein NDU88_005985 [Pleurodeles waltl]|uniref:Uncharacterized protein n=1 Tax=Pleurodeles waltl TaxID=8319 RepID=A0AAV7VNG8_PLEWA|nr:hypothetical protein NDU88_005985 [Pleurodeles waltl]